MNKRTLFWLSAIAIALVFIGVGAASYGSYCTQGANGLANCHLTAYAGVGAVIYYVGLAVAFVTWVLGLITTFRRHQWLWLVAVLVLSPFATLVYGIFAPDDRTSYASYEPFPRPGRRRLPPIYR